MRNGNTFKSFPIQTDEHFLTVARYVERNALRAKLVDRAETWQWSSLWRRDQVDANLVLGSVTGPSIAHGVGGCE
jgi:putative transposase